MATLPSVLIFTYPEYGQANVSLATAYELALAGVDVHIASFASLRDRVLRFQELFVDHHASHSSSQLSGSVTFHECKGFTPHMEAMWKRGLCIANAPHPPGVSGALGFYARIDVLLFPWHFQEYLVAINSCKDVIADVKPNVAVVDSLFYPAQDACCLLAQRFMIISPNSIKDIALSAL